MRYSFFLMRWDASLFWLYGLRCFLYYPPCNSLQVEFSCLCHYEVDRNLQEQKSFKSHNILQITNTIKFLKITIEFGWLTNWGNCRTMNSIEYRRKETFQILWIGNAFLSFYAVFANWGNTNWGKLSIRPNFSSGGRCIVQDFKWCSIYWSLLFCSTI